MKRGMRSGKKPMIMKYKPCVIPFINNLKEVSGHFLICEHGGGKKFLHQILFDAFQRKIGFDTYDFGSHRGWTFMGP